MKSIAFSCFVDSGSQGKFQVETVRFIWSLLDIINIDPKCIFITCDENVSPIFVEMVKKIGVTNLKFEKRFSKVSPPSNKWLQLKSFEYSGFDTLVLCDCDKVFVSFNNDWCDGSIRAAKFVPRPTYQIFEDIADKYSERKLRYYMDKPDPKDDFKDPRNFVNNHNGGLIFLPAEYLVDIRDGWKCWIDVLHDDIDILRGNKRNLDQVAFSFAMLELGKDINFIPKSFDVGMNVKNISISDLRNSGQLVLHIHGMDDEIGLMNKNLGASTELLTLVEELNSSYQKWLVRNEFLDMISLLRK